MISRIFTIWKQKRKVEMISRIARSSSHVHLIVELGKQKDHLDEIEIYTIPLYKWEFAEGAVKQNAFDCACELQIIAEAHTQRLAVLFMALEQCTREQVVNILKRWSELEYPQLLALYNLATRDAPLSDTERTFGGCAGWRAAILWGLARN